jgi:hypothetical protein
MRFRVAALITGLLAVTSLVLGIGVAAPALAQNSSNICTPPTSDTTGTAGDAQCWNNTAGRAAVNNPIQFWENTALGAPNNAWIAQVIGTVKDGEGGVLWPFDDGSQLNTRYNGRPVYQFAWAKDELYCASQVDFSTVAVSGILTLQKCESSTDQDFVYSSLKFLICAGASNALYSATTAVNSPVWVDEETGTGDGAGIYMDTSAVLTWSINMVF